MTSSESFEHVRDRVRQEIDKYFKLVLNRPEILNRFGENVIVFDFIRPGVANHIFGGMVASILQDTRRAGYSVSLAPAAEEALRQLCTSDLSNGGRGIRNMLETHLVNPLARALFSWTGPGDVAITAVSSGAVTELELEPA